MAGTFVIKPLFSSYLPGAGIDVNGINKQGKRIVWGQIIISSYSTNGITFTALDFGMTNVDAAFFQVLDDNGSDVANNNNAGANWRRDDDLLEIYTDGNSQLDSTHSGVVGYLAVGDSVDDVERL